MSFVSFLGILATQEKKPWQKRGGLQAKLPRSPGSLLWFQVNPESALSPQAAVADTAVCAACTFI